MVHILVVGGTGMLRNVCLHFCKSGNIVSVIARSHDKLNALYEEATSTEGTLNPLVLNYKNLQLLTENLQQSIDKFGPVEKAVCWIHSSVAPNAAQIIAKTIEKNNNGRLCSFYLLLSCSTADPSKEKIDISPQFTGFDNISLRTILLGFVIEKSKSRWLFDDEICKGVIAAIEEDKMSSVIGTVEPWDKHP